ncbi:intradiol ring-cleavage dioxygenase [Chryseobacterium sp. JUb7]|uniref:dioxygenase family protein n=1 Tax=Chryseobacterium sp. JUb7 TaxID=2940599 RepID=UPI0021681AB5|nr:intradiol ring-cleavage dioxygenase [Chryseobacterium sp. JUb7]MCS3532630.1 protocatechuate 3,4-dioxygenase beta subunit [Chryseobacterium sp. JUb7]
MDRKNFLKNLGLAGVTAIAAPVLIRCNPDNNEITNEEINCTTTNYDLEGPFPTKSPSTLERINIIGDRTGIPFEIQLTIKNKNTGCSNLEGAFVDLWHCDRQGNYSEYGGSDLQIIDYTHLHFLRGRQITNINGEVKFTSVFPGWYTIGSVTRATHLHIHIYNNKGNSLLVTQLPFPDDPNSAVVKVNESPGYKGMLGYRYNTDDDHFFDGVDTQLLNISGNNNDGYVGTRTIIVSA